MNQAALGNQNEVVRETRTTRTRPALWSALLSLLETKTLEQVTIREITARAGVGYATFFRHYPDKESLLNDLTRKQIRELVMMTVPVLIEADSKSSAQALCAYVWKNRKLWTSLLTGGAAGALKEEWIRQTQQYAVEPSDPNTGIPSDLRVLAPVAGVIEMLAWWLRQNDPPTVQRMADFIDQLIITPAVTAAAR